MIDELIIETKELTKSYGPHVALDKLSIQIQRGATGLLGPNGAGKSTFFKTILGLIQATSGEGSVLGHDVRTEGLAIRSKIGYMPEYDALDENMDAIHQVRYSGELLGMNPVVAMSRAHSNGIRRPWRTSLSSDFFVFDWNETSHEVGLFNYPRPTAHHC